MLFHSSLRKELARSFGAALVILVTIVITMTLVRTLGQASKGSVNPSEVLLVMGYTVLGYLSPILTLSLFIGIVATLSRMYRDSEMVIWFSGGRGLVAFLPPLLRFAWPVLLAVGVLALLVWPWANQQTQDLKDRYGKRGDLQRVVPGQFQESSSGNRVFFIDKDSPSSSTANHIFISATEHGKETFTSARSGSVEPSAGGQFLTLRDGHRVEKGTPESDLKVSEFREYATRINERAYTPQEASARMRSSWSLVLEPTRANQAELAWRIGLALAALNFVVLATAVSSSNPRVGRSGHLLFALFAFILYFNLLNLGQSWIASGRASFIGFLLGLHGGAFALAALWVAKQHNNWSLTMRRGAKPA